MEGFASLGVYGGYHTQWDHSYWILISFKKLTLFCMWSCTPVLRWWISWCSCFDDIMICDLDFFHFTENWFLEVQSLLRNIFLHVVWTECILWDLNIILCSVDLINRWTSLSSSWENTPLTTMRCASIQSNALFAHWHFWPEKI